MKRKSPTANWPKGFFGADDRTHIASQSALLGDPNALHFGTRLRTAHLKTVDNRFYNGSRLLKVQVL